MKMPKFIAKNRRSRKAPLLLSHKLVFKRKLYRLIFIILWKLPAFLQSPVRSLFNNVFFPIKFGHLRFIIAPEYVRYLGPRNLLRQSQWWPRWKLEQYQIKRLKQLLIYAYNNVPYYTEIFKKYNLQPSDFNSIKDLQKLPILSKEDVVKNFDKLVSKRVNRKHLEFVTTSGSTGKPMPFYVHCRERYYRNAMWYRSLSWANVKAGQRCIHLWSSPFLGQKFNKIYTRKFLGNVLSLSTVPHSFDVLGQYLRIIKRFNPVYVWGNPSMLYRLACYAQAHNTNNIKFRSFISVYENLFPHQREQIEKQFKCKVYNYYGLMERSICASECPAHEGMHIGAEFGILEILDEKGEALPEGHSGRMVATRLDSHAMPLIRYETGDIGSISNEPCSCGRGLPILKSLDGRSNEVLRYNSKIIYSATLAALMRKYKNVFKNIKECQFIQENEDKISVNIVKRAGYSKNDSHRLIRLLRNMIDEGLTIKLNFLNHIPRTRMGKFKFIISKIKPDLPRKSGYNEDSLLTDSTTYYA